VKPFRKIAAGLFGFDRRERRGTYVLSVILILFLVVRLTAFSPGRVPEDLSEMPLTNEILQAAAKDEVAPGTLFKFDPNTAKYDDLLLLGLSERQAGTLIKYREAGAKFRRPVDLKRVYGVDSATAARLMPYIIIENEIPGGSAAGGKSQRAGEAAVLNAASLHATEARITGDGFPRTGEAANSFVQKAPRSMIDLNICTAGELVSLPGIGPVLSERIIKYRSLLGGFVNKQQLMEVYGLDTAVVSLIAPMVTLTVDSVKPLLLDSASFGDLARHPYVGYEAARLITRYRTLSGAPLTLGAMVSRNVITAQQAERMAPYVRPSEGAAGNDYEFISSKVLK
jgi:DNA uptake protein ComE-like DNA-binding protein